MKLQLEMRHNINMIVRLVGFLSLLSLSAGLFAEEESWYQVEVIVFERPLPDFDGEQWQDSDYQPRDSLVELLPPEEAVVNGEPTPFSILPVSRNRLAGSERVLRLSGNYQPLLHYSWQQPAYERRDARFVHIQKLTEVAESSATPADTIEPTAVTDPVTFDDDENEPEFIEDIVDPGYLIDGAIRVRSGFYLHLDVDLSYFAAVPLQNRIVKTDEEIQAYDPFGALPVRLQETRRIKLNELHYFDHPLFGLIIQVSRLES